MAAQHRERDEPEIKRQRHRGQADDGVADPAALLNLERAHLTSGGVVKL